MSEVSRFWNDQADGYGRSVDSDWVERSHHRVTADLLNRELEDGRILCVGGPWVAADLGLDLTVLDISVGMLRLYARAGMTPILGDGRQPPLSDSSFDHVVVPLVLHHITGRGAASARENVRRAVRVAARLLEPGGRLWIKEIVVPAPIYALELFLAPLTRAALAAKKIPLVIFHTDRFFRRALSEAGLTDVRSIVSDSPDERWYDRIAPVIGLPRLRVPRLLVPVRYRLIVGERA